uniref:Alpha,alpha-trehalose-phosphate synthase (UDP-forming)-like n=1 Tax=Hirondellea gigas TaxID=1518452 RepID=A0A2P2HXG2_9CRUS
MGIQSTSPMIVVANRLPFVVAKDPKTGNYIRKQSAGGLVTAVAPVVVETEGMWVGWSGLHIEDDTFAIPESSPDDNSPTAGLKSEQVIPVNLPRKLFDDYYNGCCNACFWPLFHSMPDRAIFEEDKWDAYREVNEEFAKLVIQAVHKSYKKTPDRIPLVWIHDYHLMYAANYIRDTCNDEGLEVKMAFFLHIPFPSWDIIRLFPWADELLQGILGCDSVGFHLEDYCLNFIDCCHRKLGCRIDRQRMLIEHNKRTVSVHTLPISIPYERFVKMAEEAPVVMKASPEQLLLAVDRLDYTKGLVHRFKAFERLLEKYPEHVEKVNLFQVAVPSRTDVKEYQELKEEIDKLIGQINGRFSTPNWSPIRYIYGCITQAQLAAFYRDASVALVTPLRDGMNLVAKEFVACQTREPGVLVLSPFAGAGVTMQEALMVNPYEINHFADVMHRALTMPKDERELRMKQLRRREKERDVNFWLRNVLKSADCLGDESGESKNRLMPLSEEDINSYLSDYVNESSRLALILDYDGTLAPIAPSPCIAHLPTETKKVLERLSNMPDVNIAIISGRSLDNVKEMVGIEGITYAGNHGFEILHPDGTMFVHPVPPEYQEKLRKLRDTLSEICVNGASVEDKGPCLSFHYRKVPVPDRTAVVAQAMKLFEEAGIEVFKAHMSIEARPPVTWDTGRAVIYILRTLFGVDWSDRISIIFAGDDDTDEAAMLTLQGMAITFRVTDFQSIKTAANYRLPNTDAVLTMLRWIERRMGSRSPKPPGMGSRAGSFSNLKSRSRTSSFTDSCRNTNHGGSPTRMLSNLVMHDKDYQSIVKRASSPLLRMNSVI